jgi:crotonobetainyl-CoA:carnitine CoA-transferase CaiB-like acyl-CoA transferase
MLDVTLNALGGGAGAMTVLPVLPLEFGDSQERPTIATQPPRIGEHSRQVLIEAGLTAADIEQLTTRSIVHAG